jgi:hypothetical protein
MFKLIATMKRGSATGIPEAWASYETIEAARVGTAALFRDDRVLRAMVVRDEVRRRSWNGRNGEAFPSLTASRIGPWRRDEFTRRRCHGS